jgi:HD-GYP domain-containing protein (c-di-GMP phosphodiesterase class II)
MDKLVGAKREKAPSAPADTLALCPEHGDNPDLAFFRRLALQLDDLGIHKQGRTDSILELCLSTNRDLEQPVDVDQLTAAVYLHDLGMSLVPVTILNKPSKLTEEEFRAIRNHVDMGAEILKRMNGWEEAASMVSQHHERFDGKGYPKGLANDEIHRGAMLIALADTFYSITNVRADRNHKKSLFSAVTKINGESGTQFDPTYVEAFNETVRSHYVSQKKKTA